MSSVFASKMLVDFLRLCSNKVQQRREVKDQTMLFMVMERFKRGAGPVEERFKRDGRMLPEDVRYVASWVETDGSRCFQLMEAPGRAALNPWMARWADLVDFEVSAVETSSDFWARAAHREV